MPKPLPEPGRKKSGTLVGSQSADQIHRSISPPADEAPSSPVSLTKSVRAVKEVQKARTNAANTRRRKRNSAAEWANPQAAKKDAAAAAPAPPKSAETKAALRAALKQTEPFAELEGTQQLLALIDAMVKVDVKAGAVLVKEGADGNECYVLEAGELKASVKGEEVDRMGPGAVLGQYTLLYNVPRTATVEAVADSTLYKLDGAMFTSTLRAETVGRRREIFDFLRSCDIFANMDVRQMSKVADVVEVRQFPEGAAVVTEGDDADGMYFLKEGSCSVKQAIPEGEREEGSTETERILRILKKGAYFGECALLNDDKRTASIEAVTATTTAFVGKANFVSLLGAIHGELLSRSPTRPSRRLSKSASDSKFAAAAASPKYAPKPESMQIVKPLGAGAFARVNMVRDASTRRLYALKIISKVRLVERDAETRTANVVQEKQALEECNHPFVLSLVSAYQDREHVYLLVEPCLGGELFGLKAEYEKGMPEDLAKFYVASVTLAFQHIHALDYVYRDLKPENILIDAQGFAKVCDFGFAKKVVDRTYTLCGTPDYVPPEMLTGQGVNQAGDWWGLGVLAYELVAVRPPFMDDDINKTFAKIKKAELKFPSRVNFSGSMRNLIKGFVTKNVAGRLGYQKGGAEDVVKHAFFEDFDFDGLVNKTLAPPWRPKLKKADDTSYFDQEAMADCLEGHDLDAQEKLTADEEEQWRPVFDQLGPYIKSSPDSPPGVNRSMLKEAL